MQITLRGHHRDTFKVVPVGSTNANEFIYAAVPASGSLDLDLSAQAYEVFIRPRGTTVFLLTSLDLSEDYFYIRNLNPVIDATGQIDLTVTVDQVLVQYQVTSDNGTFPFVRQGDTVRITLIQDSGYYEGGASAPNLSVFNSTSGATTSIPVSPTGTGLNYYIDIDGPGGSATESSGTEDYYISLTNPPSTTVVEIPSTPFTIDYQPPTLNSSNISLTSPFSTSQDSTSTPSVLLIVSDDAITDNLSGVARIKAQPFIGGTATFSNGAVNDYITDPGLIGWTISNLDDYKIYMKQSGATFISDVTAFDNSTGQIDLTGSSVPGTNGAELDYYIVRHSVTDISGWNYNIAYEGGQSYNIQLNIGQPDSWTNLTGYKYGVAISSADKAGNNASGDVLDLFYSLTLDPYGLFPPGVAWEFLDGPDGNVVYPNVDGWFTSERLFIKIYLVDVVAGAPSANIEINTGDVTDDNDWIVANQTSGASALYELTKQGNQSFYARSTNTESLSSVPFTVVYNWDSLAPEWDGIVSGGIYKSRNTSSSDPISGFNRIYFDWDVLSTDIEDVAPVDGLLGAASGVEKVRLYRTTDSSVGNLVGATYDIKEYSPYPLVLNRVADNTNYAVTIEGVTGSGVTYTVHTINAGTNSLVRRINLNTLTGGAHPDPDHTYKISYNYYKDIRDVDRVDLGLIDSTITEFTDNNFPLTDASDTLYYYWGAAVDKAGNEGAGTYEVPVPAVLLTHTGISTTVLAPADVDGQLRLTKEIIDNGYNDYTFVANYGISVPIESLSITTSDIYNRTDEKHEKLLAITNIGHSIDGTTYTNVDNPQRNGELVTFGYAERGATCSGGTVDLQLNVTNIDFTCAGSATGPSTFGFEPAALTIVQYTKPYDGYCENSSGDFTGQGQTACGASGFTWHYRDYFQPVTIGNPIGSGSILIGNSIPTGSIIKRIGQLVDDASTAAFTFTPVEGKYKWKFDVKGNPSAACSDSSYTTEGSCTGAGEDWLSTELSTDGVNFDSFLAADLIVGGVLRLETGLTIWSGEYNNGIPTGSGIILDQLGLQMFDSDGDITVKMDSGANTDNGGYFRFGNDSSNFSFDPDTGKLLLTGTLTQVMPDPATIWPVVQLGVWDPEYPSGASTGYPPSSIVQWNGICSNTGYTAETECVNASATWTDGDTNLYINNIGATSTAVPPNSPWALYAVTEPQVAKSLSITSSSNAITVYPDNTSAYPIKSIVTVNNEHITPQAGYFEIEAYGYSGTTGYELPLFDPDGNSPLFTCNGATCSEDASATLYVNGDKAGFYSNILTKGIYKSGTDYIDTNRRWDYISLEVSTTDTISGNVYSDSTTIVPVEVGSDAFNAVLSNESYTITADSNGLATDWTGAFTTVALYKGAALTTDTFIEVNTWSPVQDPTTSASIALGAEITISNNETSSPRVSVNLNNSSFNSTVDLYVDIDIYENIGASAGSPLVTKRFSITKVVDATDGTDAEMLTLTSDSNVFLYDGNNGTPISNNEEIIFTANHININNTQLNWEAVLPTGATFGSIHSIWNSSISGSTDTEARIQANKFDQYVTSAGYAELTVRIWEGAGSYAAATYKDSTVIKRLDSGADSYSIILSNPVHSENTSSIINTSTELTLYKGSSVIQPRINVNYSTADIGASAEGAALAAGATTYATEFNITLQPGADSGQVNFIVYDAAGSTTDTSDDVFVSQISFPVVRVQDGDSPNNFSILPESSFAVYSELGVPTNEYIEVQTQTSLSTGATTDVDWVIFDINGATLDHATGTDTDYIKYLDTDKIKVYTGGTFDDAGASGLFNDNAVKNSRQFKVYAEYSSDTSFNDSTIIQLVQDAPSAKTIHLTHNSQMFTYNADTSENGPSAINIEAIVSDNITGTVDWTCSEPICKATNNSLIGADNNGYTGTTNDNKIKILQSDFSTNGSDSITIRAKDPNSDIYDEFTVFKVSEESGSLLVYSTNPSRIISSGPDTPPHTTTGAGTISIIKVFKGATEVPFNTSGATFTWDFDPNTPFEETGCTADTSWLNTYPYVGITYMSQLTAHLVTNIVFTDHDGSTSDGSVITTYSLSRQGSTGAAAKTVSLSSDDQVFKIGIDGSNTPATINIRAHTSNLTTDGTWFVDGGTITGSTADIGYTSGGVTGPSATVSFADFSNGMSITYRAHTQDGSVEDTISLYELIDGPSGTDAVTGFLTNEAHTLQASSDGTVTDYTGSGGSFSVFDGLTPATGVTFSVQSYTGNWNSNPTDNSTPGINTSTGVYSISDLNSNTATITFRAEYNGINIDKIYTISKSTAGIPAYTVGSTNSVHNYHSDSTGALAGNVMSMGSHAVSFLKGTDVFTYSSSTGTTGTYVLTNISIDGDNATNSITGSTSVSNSQLVYTPTTGANTISDGSTAINNATVTLTVQDGIDTSAEFNIVTSYTKTEDGLQGDTGATGSTGATGVTGATGATAENIVVSFQYDTRSLNTITVDHDEAGHWIATGNNNYNSTTNQGTDWSSPKWFYFNNEPDTPATNQESFLTSATINSIIRLRATSGNAFAVYKIENIDKGYAIDMVGYAVDLLTSSGSMPGNGDGILLDFYPFAGEDQTLSVGMLTSDNDMVLYDFNSGGTHTNISPKIKITDSSLRSILTAIDFRSWTILDYNGMTGDGGTGSTGPIYSNYGFNGDKPALCNESGTCWESNYTGVADEEDIWLQLPSTFYSAGPTYDSGYVTVQLTFSDSTGVVEEKATTTVQLVPGPDDGVTGANAITNAIANVIGSGNYVFKQEATILTLTDASWYDPSINGIPRRYWDIPAGFVAATSTPGLPGPTYGGGTTLSLLPDPTSSLSFGHHDITLHVVNPSGSSFTNESTDVWTIEVLDADQYLGPTGPIGPEGTYTITYTNRENSTAADFTTGDYAFLDEWNSSVNLGITGSTLSYSDLEGIILDKIPYGISDHTTFFESIGIGSIITLHRGTFNNASNEWAKYSIEDVEYYSAQSAYALKLSLLANGSGSLDNSSFVFEFHNWITGAQGPQGDTGATGSTGATGYIENSAIISADIPTVLYDFRSGGTHENISGRILINDNTVRNSGAGSISREWSITHDTTEYGASFNASLWSAETGGTTSVESLSAVWLEVPQLFVSNGPTYENDYIQVQLVTEDDIDITEATATTSIQLVVGPDDGVTGEHAITNAFALARASSSVLTTGALETTLVIDNLSMYYPNADQGWYWSDGYATGCSGSGILTNTAGTLGASNYSTNGSSYLTYTTNGSTGECDIVLKAKNLDPGTTNSHSEYGIEDEYTISISVLSTEDLTGPPGEFNTVLDISSQTDMVLYDYQTGGTHTNITGRVQILDTSLRNDNITGITREWSLSGSYNDAELWTQSSGGTTEVSGATFVYLELPSYIVTDTVMYVRMFSDDSNLTSGATVSTLIQLKVGPNDGVDGENAITNAVANAAPSSNFVIYDPNNLYSSNVSITNLSLYAPGMSGDIYWDFTYASGLSAAAGFTTGYYNNDTDFGGGSSPLVVTPVSLGNSGDVSNIGFKTKNHSGGYTAVSEDSVIINHVHIDDVTGPQGDTGPTGGTGATGGTGPSGSDHEPIVWLEEGATTDFTYDATHQNYNIDIEYSSGTAAGLQSYINYQTPYIVFEVNDNNTINNSTLPLIVGFSKDTTTDSDQTKAYGSNYGFRFIKSSEILHGYTFRRDGSGQSTNTDYFSLSDFSKFALSFNGSSIKWYKIDSSNVVTHIRTHEIDEDTPLYLSCLTKNNFTINNFALTTTGVVGPGGATGVGTFIDYAYTLGSPGATPDISDITPVYNQAPTGEAVTWTLTPISMAPNSGAALWRSQAVFNTNNETISFEWSTPIIVSYGGQDGANVRFATLESAGYEFTSNGVIPLNYTDGTSPGAWKVEWETTTGMTATVNLADTSRWGNNLSFELGYPDGILQPVLGPFSTRNNNYPLGGQIYKTYTTLTVPPRNRIKLNFVLYALHYTADSFTTYDIIYIKLKDSVNNVLISLDTGEGGLQSNCSGQNASSGISINEISNNVYLIGNTDTYAADAGPTGGWAGLSMQQACEIEYTGEWISSLNNSSEILTLEVYTLSEINGGFNSVETWYIKEANLEIVDVYPEGITFTMKLFEGGEDISDEIAIENAWTLQDGTQVAGNGNREIVLSHSDVLLEDVLSTSFDDSDGNSWDVSKQVLDTSDLTQNKNVLASITDESGAGFIFKYDGEGSTPTPSIMTLTARLTDTSTGTEISSADTEGNATLQYYWEKANYVPNETPNWEPHSSASNKTIELDHTEVATTLSLRCTVTEISSQLSDTHEITITDLTDGIDGSSGAAATPIVFRGTWDEDEEYYYEPGESGRRDVVKHEGTYYQLLFVTGLGSGFTSIYEPNDSHADPQCTLFGNSCWEAFGGSFSSVATDLLLAQDAYIHNNLVVGSEANSGGGHIKVVHPYTSGIEGLTEDSTVIGPYLDPERVTQVGIVRRGHPYPIMVMQKFIWGWQVGNEDIGPPGICNGDSTHNNNIVNCHAANRDYIVYGVGSGANAGTRGDFWRQNQIFVDRQDPDWNNDGSLIYPRYIPPNRKLVFTFTPTATRSLYWDDGLAGNNNPYISSEITEWVNWHLSEGTFEENAQMGEAMFGESTNETSFAKSTFAFYDNTADIASGEYGSMSNDTSFYTPFLTSDILTNNEPLYKALVDGSMSGNDGCNFGPYFWEIPSPCLINNSGVAACDEDKPVDKLKLASTIFRNDMFEEGGAVLGGVITVWEVDANGPGHSICDNTWQVDTGGVTGTLQPPGSES